MLETSRPRDLPDLCSGPGFRRLQAEDDRLLARTLDCRASDLRAELGDGHPLTEYRNHRRARKTRLRPVSLDAVNARIDGIGNRSERGNESGEIENVMEDGQR